MSDSDGTSRQRSGSFLAAVLRTATITRRPVQSSSRPPPSRPMSAAVRSVWVCSSETHGAPQYSQVLRTAAQYRLGLSATPDREELDESGEPISYDEQVLGRELGEVVFS